MRGPLKRLAILPACVICVQVALAAACTNPYAPSADAPGAMDSHPGKEAAVGWEESEAQGAKVGAEVPPAIFPRATFLCARLDQFRRRTFPQTGAGSPIPKHGVSSRPRRCPTTTATTSTPTSPRSFHFLHSSGSPVEKVVSRPTWPQMHLTSSPNPVWLLSPRLLEEGSPIYHLDTGQLPRREGG